MKCLVESFLMPSNQPMRTLIRFHHPIRVQTSWNYSLILLVLNWTWCWSLGGILLLLSVTRHFCLTNTPGQLKSCYPWMVFKRYGIRHVESLLSLFGVAKKTKTNLNFMEPKFFFCHSGQVSNRQLTVKGVS